MAAEIFDQEEQYGDGSIHDAFDPQKQPLAQGALLRGIRNAIRRYSVMTP
jgi:hypothetical protein